MTDAETADLVARAASGDRDAFRRVVNGHHALVYRWALKATGDADEADDLAQTVWIKVFRNLSAFRGGAKFTTWLYRITFTSVATHRRTRDRRTALLDGWDTPASGTERDGADPVDAARFTDAVRGYVEELPPRQRAVFELADLEGLTSAQIAEMLEIREVTVRTNLIRARRAIRSKMLAERPQLMEEYRS